MNAQRRKQLDEIISKLEDIKQDLVTLQDEEQEYYDNMPEGIQAGEKGDKADTAINSLDEAVSNLNDAIDNITTAQE